MMQASLAQCGTVTEGEAELSALLAAKPHPSIYDGVEPSSRMTLSQVTNHLPKALPVTFPSPAQRVSLIARSPLL